jgi:hypothetical protein
MALPPQSETELLVSILRVLESWGCWVHRVQTGGSRKLRYGLGVGGPDILVLDHGKAIAIEVKRSRGGVVSDAQHAWRIDWKQAGGQYAVVRSVAEALQVIENNRKAVRSG